MPVVWTFLLPPMNFLLCFSRDGYFRIPKLLQLRTEVVYFGVLWGAISANSATTFSTIDENFTPCFLVTGIFVHRNYCSHALK